MCVSNLINLKLIQYHKMLILRNFSLKIGSYMRSFCTSEQPTARQQEKVLEYSSWAIARSQEHNHNVSHLKRQFSKDRYSIQKLTNLQFMIKIIKSPQKYYLKLNQNIILYSQIFHVLQVMGRQPTLLQSLYISNLLDRIFFQIQDPPDLICFGSLMTVFANKSNFNQGYWHFCVENILMYKFDQNYDELFGIVVGLSKYRQNKIQKHQNFFQATYDKVLPMIPIIYRNSLEVIRQFVTHNVYNIKQCKLLFEAFYQVNINQGYFWDSVLDWFNIYIKEQLSKKLPDQFFIVKQNAIPKILFDQGIIRPRPILQQLASIAFNLSQFGNTSWRFIQFTQDLVIYAIQNGSELYKKFQDICAEEQKWFEENPQQSTVNVNEHIHTKTEQQKQNIKMMQKKYKTVFINPISLKDEYIIYLLVVFSRAYKMYEETQNKKQQYKDKKESLYDRKNQIILDSRVKNWLLLQIVKKQMKCTLKQLLWLYRCRQFLANSKINLVQFISDRLCNLRRTNCTFDELKQIMGILYPMDYDKLFDVLIDFLSRAHPSQILKFTKYLENNNYFIYMSYYMLRLPKAVNIHEKYFSFEENCYFMYMLLRNANCIDLQHCSPYVRMNYEGQMEKIKESLKIATYNRGFKLTMDSYFHKILDYIDVVEFFQSNRP